ncbi:MAG: hypothetical protein M1818_002869 [Claussenomyces sp. TS43310]|nr:MAG: hypothetical protein M1818_002869 [Claussenomyces sp. TS43310]
MARDTLEILNHVGWTEERQLHVIGLSMGGMISQELALLIPNRICSLNLVSTAARIENTTTFFANLRTRINMFIPKSLDRSVADAGAAMFAAAWLDAPDDTHLPDLSTPGVLPPAVPSTSPNSGYGRFETNYQRYAALELTKRLNPEVFERKGFLLQVLATGFHHKSAEQLKRLADEVGRERILVMHGTEDNMLTVHHGRVLIRELNPSTHSIGEGIGHLFMMEKTAWFHDTLEDMFARAEKLVAK